jgi:hypothetical protein
MNILSKIPIVGLKRKKEENKRRFFPVAGKNA